MAVAAHHRSDDYWSITAEPDALHRASETSIQFECFTRGGPAKDTKVSNENISLPSGRFTIKTAAAAAASITVPILLEAQARLKAAIKAGEPTSYYTGASRLRRRAEWTTRVR